MFVKLNGKHGTIWVNMDQITWLRGHTDEKDQKLQLTKIFTNNERELMIHGAVEEIAEQLNQTIANMVMQYASNLRESDNS